MREFFVKDNIEMSDEYEHVARGKLKLKSDSGKVSKKHKSKKNKKDQRPDNSHESSTKYDEKVPKAPERQLTKAEMSFKKMQVKMVSGI